MVSVVGAIAGVDYTSDLGNGSDGDAVNPTAAELQAVYDAATANYAGAAGNAVASVTSGNGSGNGVELTPEQLNGLVGVGGAIAGVDYTSALGNGSYVDAANPTAAEIQAVIDLSLTHISRCRRTDACTVPSGTGHCVAVAP